MKQLTYEELYHLIEKMTPLQRQFPVKMYTTIDGELHPDDESIHPECGFSSKLVSPEKIKEYIDEINPNQYVIMEYMNKEDQRKCEILHLKKSLLRNDLTDKRRNYYEKKLRKLGEEV